MAPLSSENKLALTPTVTPAGAAVKGRASSGVPLLGTNPLTAGRQVLDAHRGSDVQPHPVPEELIDPLGPGIRESLDERHQAGVAAPYPVADDGLVAGVVRLMLEHRVVTVGIE